MDAKIQQIIHKEKKKRAKSLYNPKKLRTFAADLCEISI